MNSKQIRGESLNSMLNFHRPDEDPRGGKSQMSLGSGMLDVKNIYIPVRELLTVPPNLQIWYG